MWDPFRDIEDSFRRMMGGMVLPSSSSDGTHRWGYQATSMGRWLPPMDVSENDTQYIVSADIPGTKKEDMEVNVSGNRVCVRANRQGPQREGEWWAHCSERGQGKFERCFTLPSQINESTVSAQYNDGVLEVTMEKLKTGRDDRVVRIK